MLEQKCEKKNVAKLNLSNSELWGLWCWSQLCTFNYEKSFLELYSKRKIETSKVKVCQRLSEGTNHRMVFKLRKTCISRNPFLDDWP